MNSSGGKRQEAAKPMGKRARRPWGQDRDVQLSKALSYALRHGALKLGLPMGADGFVPLHALLQLPQFHSFSTEDVQRVVDTNEKQRFTLQPGEPNTGPLIRANQGHSIQVPELELMPLKMPQALSPMLVHGTFWKHWPSILLKGLSCQGRMHIHLAPGLPGDSGVISGMRPNCEVAVFIDGPLALADGIPFFRSANGVILTPGNADGFLLPKYFKEALQLRPTRENHHPTCVPESCALLHASCKLFPSHPPYNDLDILSSKQPLSPPQESLSPWPVIKKQSITVAPSSAPEEE